MSVDDKALKRSIDAIVHDVLKLPGQAGLDDAERFSLSMETLTLVTAQVVFTLSDGHDASLLETFNRRVGKHVATLRHEWERQRPAGRILERIREALTSLAAQEQTKVTCPHCGIVADYALGESKPGMDLMVCFGCGGVGVADPEVQGGARKATEAEEKVVNDNPSVRMARDLWAKVGKKKEREP